jgi:hypothetical protein
VIIPAFGVSSDRGWRARSQSAGVSADVRDPDLLTGAVHTLLTPARARAHSRCDKA